MMSTNTFWSCRTCGADVPGKLLECPHCTRPSRPAVKSIPLDESDTPAWVRGVSIPGALFGLLAFFLPWMAVSCGPLRLSATGYEMATGTWSNKVSQQNIDSFYNRTNKQLRQQMGLRQQRLQPRRNVPNTPEASETQNDPLLWIVPGACLLLAILGFAGLPRVPSILVSVIGAAYLAYFGITSEQQLNDPGNTGGFLAHEWLLGYWISWIGMLVPMFAAIFRPTDRAR